MSYLTNAMNKVAQAKQKEKAQEDALERKIQNRRKLQQLPDQAIKIFNEAILSNRFISHLCEKAVELEVQNRRNLLQRTHQVMEILEENELARCYTGHVFDPDAHLHINELTLIDVSVDPGQRLGLFGDELKKYERSLSRQERSDEWRHCLRKRLFIEPQDFILRVFLKRKLDTFMQETFDMLLDIHKDNPRALERLAAADREIAKLGQPEASAGRLSFNKLKF